MNFKKKLIEAVKDQQSIFGDTLFEALPEPEKKIKEESRAEFHVKEKVELENTGSFFMDDFQKADSLNKLYKLIHECQKCPLGKTRTKFVFGVGNPNADILLIGEAPGRDEDLQGEPFVGRAGKLLNDILIAINLEREEVYIANILKCRPPNNRNPEPSEMQTCMPYLHKQIELIKPKLILCLGLIAATALFNKKLTLGQLRGNIYEFNGIKTMVTYHPAALLRNPNWKKGCWQDVRQFRKLYDEIKDNR